MIASEPATEAELGSFPTGELRFYFLRLYCFVCLSRWQRTGVHWPPGLPMDAIANWWSRSNAADASFPSLASRNSFSLFQQ